MNEWIILCYIILWVLGSDLKHRANDARDGLSSYSNRRDQSGLNSCCTAMWKANGKTTILSLFLDSLFPKTEIPYIDLKDRRGYCQLKEEALDRTMWRNRFGRGFGPVVWQITDDDDDYYIMFTEIIALSGTTKNAAHYLDKIGCFNPKEGGA